MSGTTDNGDPALTDSVREIQAKFPDDATLQAAVAQLELANYDRSDLSLPEDQPKPSSSTSHGGTDDPSDNTDKQQLRTMAGGMAGTIAGFALAGATIATGGAAGVAALGAAAAGAGATAAASATGKATEAASDKTGTDARDQRGAEGTLLLAIRTQGAKQARQVVDIVRAAGATEVRPVTASEEALTAGISSASWTGD